MFPLLVMCSVTCLYIVSYSIYSKHVHWIFRILFYNVHVISVLAIWPMSVISNLSPSQLYLSFTSLSEPITGIARASELVNEYISGDTYITKVS